MKYLGFLLVLVLLFLGGYFVQPFLTRLLVKDQVSMEVYEKEVVVNGFKVKVNLENLEADLKPKELELKQGVSFAGPEKTDARDFEKGKTVTLVEIKKGHLVVADPADPAFTALVPSESTDIFERAAKLKFEAGQKAVAVNPIPPVAPVPPMADPEGVEPPEVPSVPAADPDPDPEVAATPTEMPEPVTPDPTPVSSAPAGAEEIVALMKASVESGAIKEFKADQVDSWTAGESETLDGVEYQVGLASYQAETIFGVKPVEAKALIRGGKVEKWVYAKTGMEIR